MDAHSVFAAAARSGRAATPGSGGLAGADTSGAGSGETASFGRAAAGGTASWIFLAAAGGWLLLPNGDFRPGSRKRWALPTTAFLEICSRRPICGRVD